MALFVVRANATGKGQFSGVVYPNNECKGSSTVFAEGDEPGPAAAVPFNFVQQLLHSIGLSREGSPPRSTLHQLLFCSNFLTLSCQSVNVLSRSLQLLCSLGLFDTHFE